MEGQRSNEKAFDGKNKCIIRCNKIYFRPLEVDHLKEIIKANKLLKWKPKYNLDSLIDEMITEEFKLIKK